MNAPPSKCRSLNHVERHDRTVGWKDGGCYGLRSGHRAAIARCFAAERARVVVAELNPETGAAMAAELKAAGASALFARTDVTDPASVAAMHDATRVAFGTPDILVNNAGINVFRDPLAMSDQDWDRCMSVDLEGVWRCTRAFLRE